MSKYKVEQVWNVFTEKYVTTTDALKEIDNMIASGKKYHALPYILGIYNVARDEGDEKLLKECERRKSKIELPYEKREPYAEGGAADPNNKPKNILQTDINEDTNKPKREVGNKTVILSIKGENRGIINNRLDQARKVLVGGKFLDAGEEQWRAFFSGHTTYDEMKWTGDKGHFVYFIKAIQDYLKNNTGFGIWEIFAAHFIWYRQFKKKLVEESFDHKKLSEGKATQDSVLDSAANWFRPEMNPSYKSKEDDDAEEEHPYEYDKDLTDAEQEYDARSCGLDVPKSKIFTNESLYDGDSGFHLSDEM